MYNKIECRVQKKNYVIGTCTDLIIFVIVFKFHFYDVTICILPFVPKMNISYVMVR